MTCAIFYFSFPWNIRSWAGNRIWNRGGPLHKRIEPRRRIWLKPQRPRRKIWWMCQWSQHLIGGGIRAQRQYKPRRSESPISYRRFK